MFRLFGKSLSHNYHPCMAKLPTFGLSFMGNVGESTIPGSYVYPWCPLYPSCLVVCEANGTNSNIKSHTVCLMLWDEMALSANLIYMYFYPPLCEGVDTKTRLKIFRKIWSKRLETDAGKHVYTVFDSTSLHVFGMLWHAALRHALTALKCFEDLETIIFSFRAVGLLWSSRCPAI